MHLSFPYFKVMMQKPSSKRNSGSEGLTHRPCPHVQQHIKKGVIPGSLRALGLSRLNMTPGKSRSHYVERKEVNSFLSRAEVFAPSGVKFVNADHTFSQEVPRRMIPV